MLRPDWAARLRLAVLSFGMSPEAFWRLSLNEWRALTHAPEPERLSRPALERLLEEHPDG